MAAAPRCVALITNIEREPGGFTSKRSQCAADAEVELTSIGGGSVATACHNHVALVARTLLGRPVSTRPKAAPA